MSEHWPPPQQVDIPPEIEQAALSGNLVIFVGAGVSKLAGAPSWDEFATKTLEDLAKKNAITYAVIRQLSHLDARQKLTIASLIAKKENLNIDYPSLLEVTESKSNIYGYIKEIGCAYVTTNYDGLLFSSVSSSTEGTVPPNHTLICNPEQFLAGVLLEPGTVVHLHGSIFQRDSMIITMADYLRHYGNKYVKDFLSELFAKHTVLFVGYGLGEIEILEHILRKGRVSSQAEKKRFILQGYYSYEQNLFRYVCDYFKECFGVYVLSFILDHREYHQIETVMKDWAAHLEVREPALSEHLEFVLEVAGE
jgi:hypothetical protein